MVGHSHNCGYGFYGSGDGRGRTSARSKVWKTFQQGDSFGFPMIHKINGQAVDVDEGYFLSVGFFDEKGNRLHRVEIGNGMVRTGVGTYFVKVGHEVSVNMLGLVTLEFVVYDENRNVVDHSTNMATLFFEPRGMNKGL